MMPAMPKRVILNDELRRYRSAETKRERSGPIQLFVRKCAHRFRSVSAVYAQKFERLGFLNGRVLACVLRVQLGDGLPGDIGDWLAGCNCLRKLNLDGVHAGNMMHHRTDRTPIGW